MIDWTDAQLDEMFLRSEAQRRRITDDLRGPAAVRHEDDAATTDHLGDGDPEVLVRHRMGAPAMLRDEPH